MTANDSKPYLPYLNKSVDQYNNTYHSINKKTIKKLLMLIVLLWLKTLSQILKLLNLK